MHTSSHWELMSGYTPIFTSWQGELYESELVRAAIDSRARHVSKLRIGFEGSAHPELIARLKKAPNGYQTWSQFLYRVSTILDMQNTCFILPVLDRYGETTGLTTMLPQTWELVDYNGEPWLRLTDYKGKHASIELARVGILTKYQYHSDLFGDSNNALQDTMSLIAIQTQGIQEAIKNSNTYRFWARSNNLVKADDLKKERERFSRENFGADGGGGLLLFPNIYSDIHQAESKPYTVDYNTMQLIQTNVLNYFGTNLKIIQNTATAQELDAFFNGAVEPLVIQTEEVLNKMLYTPTELAYGNTVKISSARLQYMTTTQKVQLVRELGDRGCLLVDEIRDLFNYPALPDGAGQVAPARGEYKDVGTLLTTPRHEETDEETEQDEDE